MRWKSFVLHRVRHSTWFCTSSNQGDVMKCMPLNRWDIAMDQDTDPFPTMTGRFNEGWFWADRR